MEMEACELSQEGKPSNGVGITWRKWQTLVVQDARNKKGGWMTQTAMPVVVRDFGGKVN